MGNQRLEGFSVFFGVTGAHDVLKFGGLKLTGECPSGNVGLSASNVSGQAAALQAGWIKESGVAMSALGSGSGT